MMGGLISARKGPLVRAATALVLGLGLVACDQRGDNPSGVVYLPETTTRINARDARNSQLESATYQDDLPEYTGAPSPKGRWPAGSGTGKAIYRDDATLEVGSEGPYAKSGAASGS